ncbi:MAG: DNA alkylation repair protein [Bacteroidales bacterium]
MDDNKRRQIKNCFRQAMNADLSNSMRAHGLNYRMNFGVPSPRIKLIAAQFEANADDAVYLWNEDVRESKMLATYLFPKEEMTPDLATEWAQQIPYTEIADQACMNLFVHLPFASQLAMEWIHSANEMVIYTGLRLWVRLLLLQQYPDTAGLSVLLDILKKILQSDTLYLKQVALTVAEKIAEAGEGQQKILAESLSDWKNSSDAEYADLYRFICYWDEV